MVAKKIKAYLVDRGIKQSWLVEQMQSNGIKMSTSKLSAILSGSRPLWADVFAGICKALEADANLFTSA